MDNRPHSHNHSAQQHVQTNHDPALDTVNEHVHGHLHHTAHAEQGRTETDYSKGTTYEHSNIPSQDLHDQPVHRRHPLDSPTAPAAIADAEKGDFSRDSSSEDDPRTHTLSNIYLKYRIFFHLFIWLLFTGFVNIPSSAYQRRSSLLLQRIRNYATQFHLKNKKADKRVAGGLQDSSFTVDMIR